MSFSKRDSKDSKNSSLEALITAVTASPVLFSNTEQGKEFAHLVKQVNTNDAKAHLQQHLLLEYIDTYIKERSKSVGLTTKSEGLTAIEKAIAKDDNIKQLLSSGKTAFKGGKDDARILNTFQEDHLKDFRKAVVKDYLFDQVIDLLRRSTQGGKGDAKGDASKQDNKAYIQDITNILKIIVRMGPEAIAEWNAKVDTIIATDPQFKGKYEPALSGATGGSLSALVIGNKGHDEKTFKAGAEKALEFAAKYKDALAELPNFSQKKTRDAYRDINALETLRAKLGTQKDHSPSASPEHSPTGAGSYRSSAIGYGLFKERSNRQSETGTPFVPKKYHQSNH